MEDLNKIISNFESKHRYEIDTLVLHDRFISEIENLMDERNLTRRKLAKHISVTPSHITQVFKGKKLLNLPTLAKIQDFLQIDFQVKAVAKQEVEYRESDFSFEYFTNSILNAAISRPITGVAPIYEFPSSPSEPGHETQEEKVA